MAALGPGIYVLAAAIAVLVVLTRRVVVVTLRDATWLLAGPPPSRPAVELVERYLRRVRVHRRLGALAGAGLALAVGLSRYHAITLGIGLHSPASDLLFGGLAGLLVGSVLAESYRIRPSGPRRQAAIEVRAEPDDVRQLRPLVLAFTAITVALVAVGPSWRSGMLAAGAVAVAATQVLVVRAVVERRRPALPDDLRSADDRIRTFATRRLSAETLAAALLLVGWQVTTVSAGPDAVQIGVAVVALLGTMVLIVRSRPYPPRGRR